MLLIKTNSDGYQGIGTGMSPMGMKMNGMNQQMDRLGMRMNYPPNGAAQHQQINQRKTHTSF